MSKVTDRLDNKHIIELAKQNYEQTKQTSKFPANIITLPSAGKVYPESSALSSGKIEMRHMTAYDEDILTNSSYLKDGVVFDKLLEALIVTPGVSVNEMIIGDKEWAVISARILGYGTDYPVTVTDPETNEVVTANLDLSKLKMKSFNLKNSHPGLFEYKLSTGDVIQYKYLTTKESDELNSDSFASDFLIKTVIAVNQETSKDKIEEFFKYECRAIDSRKFRKHVAESAPGLDYNTTAVSEQGGTIPAMFQFDTKLFWF